MAGGSRDPSTAADPVEGTRPTLTWHSTAVAMFLHQYGGPQAQGSEPRRSSPGESQALIFCTTKEKGGKGKKKKNHGHPMTLLPSQSGERKQRPWRGDTYSADEVGVHHLHEEPHSLWLIL